MISDKDNKTLDNIGRELFRRRQSGGKVVTRVVANPELFAGVLKRIEEPTRVKAGFRLYAATLSSVAVLTITAIGLVSLLRSSNKELAGNTIAVQVPAQKPETARPDLPPPSVGNEEDDTLPGRANYRPRPERPMVENASYTSDRQRPQRALAQRDEFYGLTYGDPSETNGGRIVRVELPRASLFAMGINVPLENDSETVKADLLIGPDGVTRAIRLVK